MLNSRLAVTLAACAAALCVESGDSTAAYRWLEVWQDHDVNPAFARAARARAAGYIWDASARILLALLERTAARR